MDMNTLHCLECPQHSIAESEGSTVCTCENGHYRAPGEGPQVACTRKSCSQGLAIYQQVLDAPWEQNSQSLPSSGDAGSQPLMKAGPALCSL